MKSFYFRIFFFCSFLMLSSCHKRNATASHEVQNIISNHPSETDYISVIPENPSQTNDIQELMVTNTNSLVFSGQNPDKISVRNQTSIPEKKMMFQSRETSKVHLTKKSPAKKNISKWLIPAIILCTVGLVILLPGIAAGSIVLSILGGLIFAMGLINFYFAFSK